MLRQGSDYKISGYQIIKSPGDPTARHAKAVVGIMKVRRNAGTSRTTSDFDVMAPRSTPRGLALTLLRPRRVAAGRNGIVSGIVPVAAPFVNVVAHVVKAKVVGRVTSHRFGPRLPARCVVRQ